MSSSDYSRRQIAADLGLLGVVATALIGVHLAIPDASRSGYAAGGLSDTTLSLLTGAYVHGGTTHLLDNLVGFGVCGILSGSASVV